VCVQRYSTHKYTCTQNNRYTYNICTETVYITETHTHTHTHTHTVHYTQVQISAYNLLKKVKAEYSSSWDPSQELRVSLAI